MSECVFTSSIVNACGFLHSRPTNTSGKGIKIKVCVVVLKSWHHPHRTFVKSPIGIFQIKSCVITHLKFTQIACKLKMKKRFCCYSNTTTFDIDKKSWYFLTLSAWVPTIKTGALGAWHWMELSQNSRPPFSYPLRAVHNRRYTAREERKNWKWVANIIHMPQNISTEHAINYALYFCLVVAFVSECMWQIYPCIGCMS